MKPINEKTWIDTSLITCAEYQLFVDEMRAKGIFVQPDHWTDYEFPKGTAHDPILGVRPSDAFRFCEWLHDQAILREHTFRPSTKAEAIAHKLSGTEHRLQGYWTYHYSLQPQFYWESKHGDNNSFDLMKDKTIYILIAYLAALWLHQNSAREASNNPQQNVDLIKALARRRSLDHNLTNTILNINSKGSVQKTTLREIFQLAILQAGLECKEGKEEYFDRDRREYEYRMERKGNADSPINLKQNKDLYCDLFIALDLDRVRDLAFASNHSYVPAFNRANNLDRIFEKYLDIALNRDLQQHKREDTINHNYYEPPNLENRWRYWDHALGVSPDLSTGEMIGRYSIDQHDYVQEYTVDQSAIQVNFYMMSRSKALNRSISIALSTVKHFDHKNLFESDLESINKGGKVEARSAENSLLMIMFAAKLALLEERIAGHYPAFEGIRIVKER